MKVIHSYSTHIQIDMYTVGVHVCIHKKVYGNIKAYCCEINETRLNIQRFVSYALLQKHLETTVLVHVC